MLGRIVLGVCLVVACSNRSEVTSTTPVKSHRIPILPDSVLAQLGAVNVAIAADFSRADVGRIASILPDEVACARDLVRSIRVGVLGVTALGPAADTPAWPT